MNEIIIWAIIIAVVFTLIFTAQELEEVEELIKRFREKQKKEK